MPKLKGDDLAGFDPDELDVEWEDTDFDTYEGEDPPSGTVLKGHIKKLWWTYAQDETPMIKVLFVASGNAGSTAEYNGLPIWDNLVFKPSAAFKYGPFLQAHGITLRDIKTKTIVAEDDDNMGAPIEKIGKWEPGEDAECGVVTKREKYKSEWSTRVGKFIETPDVEDDDDDDEEDEAPARSRKKPAARTAAASKQTGRGAAKSRRRPEPEPEDDDEEDVDDDVDDEEDEDTTPSKPARRSARSKPAARTRAPAKPARKTSSRKSAADDDDEDDPF